MTNDVVPSAGENFWDKVNLPKLVAGPAGEAISKLVAGATAIPTAWLDSFAQGMRDRTEAKSAMSRALAQAAGDFVTNDPAIVERAAHAFLAKEIRKQHHRERVAEKTIEDLKANPDAETKAPDDDWLNMFSRYAEDASSERLQQLLASILAGQLRRPQSISLHTLRVAAELDEQTVKLLDKWNARAAAGGLIYFPERSGPLFAELRALEEAGLVSGAAGTLQHPIDVAAGSPPFLQFLFRGGSVTVAVEVPYSVGIRSAALTKVGRELGRVLPTTVPIEELERFAAHYKKTKVIQIVGIVQSGKQMVSKELWKSPTP